VWSVEFTIGRWVLWALYFLGWAIVFYTSFLIDHFELFGLKQVWLHLMGREPTTSPFSERSIYRWVRHPLMLGFIIAFWSAPTMSQGRLLFAAVSTIWILIAIRIEERDHSCCGGFQAGVAGSAVPANLAQHHCGAEPGGDLRRAVGGTVVDDNSPHSGRQSVEHPGQGGCLVQAGEDEIDFGWGHSSTVGKILALLGWNANTARLRPPPDRCWWRPGEAGRSTLVAWLLVCSWWTTTRRCRTSFRRT